jgi:hypothetical protein
MRTPSAKLAVVALALCTGLGLGCGGASTDASHTSHRLVKQENLSLAGVVSITWLYTYDAAGYLTENRAYNASNVLTSIVTHSYTGGLQTGTISRAPTGATTGSQLFTYTGGVLSRTDSLGSTGALASYSTYVFVNGRKLTTNRFTPAGVSTGAVDFSYDPTSGRRTTMVYKDAAGTTLMTGIRTYVGDLWTQAQLDYPGSTNPSAIRRFTYEVGPALIDPDLFFEF